MPSLRKRGDRWMVIYRDDAGQQRSAGSYKTEAEARKVLRKTVDGVTPVEEAQTYSSKNEEISSYFAEIESPEFIPRSVVLTPGYILSLFLRLVMLQPPGYRGLRVAPRLLRGCQ